MIVTYVRFYEELNDFLPARLSKKTMKKEVLLSTTVKDIVESYGVPHTEVDLILVNGESVSFGYKIVDQDRISVYPVFESFDITPVKHLQAKPLRIPCFFAEKYLWKLTRLLRLLGINVIYDDTLTNKQVIELIVSSKQILLTRSVQQLMHSTISRGYCIRADDPVDQAIEVMKRFDLLGQMLPFSRCMLCNGSVVKIPMQTVESHLDSKTASLYTKYFQCSDCKKIYWKGSHYKQLQRFVDQVKSALMNIIFI
ncbi:MAG: Mut7-C RNAse domain-containing protein [Candidatus Neomarinimicrobiota bacterium]